jgi:hypothetical protein
MFACGDVVVSFILTLSVRLARSGTTAMVGLMAITPFVSIPAVAQDQPPVPKTIALTVEASGELPGFDMADVPQYLISRMLDAEWKVGGLRRRKIRLRMLQTVSNGDSIWTLTRAAACGRSFRFRPSGGCSAPGI